MTLTPTEITVLVWTVRILGAVLFGLVCWLAIRQWNKVHVEIPDELRKVREQISQSFDQMSDKFATRERVQMMETHWGEALDRMMKDRRAMHEESKDSFNLIRSDIKHQGEKVGDDIERLDGKIDKGLRAVHDRIDQHLAK
jgi:hypothetical protein